MCLKYVHVTGKINLKELRALAEIYLDDPKFSADLRFLVDLTQLIDARAKFMDVFTLKGYYEKRLGHLGNPVEVVIVAPTDLGYGISRMFSALMSDGKIMRVRIVDDMESAANVLQLQATTLLDLQMGANV
jgi:hypothetical protein